MKLSKEQSRQIRRLAILSTTLLRSRLMLSDFRREKLELLRGVNIGLKGAQDRLATARSFSWVGGTPSGVTEEIASASESILKYQDAATEINEDIRNMDAQLETLGADCGQAYRLVENLLKQSGGTHEDFPGVNATFVAR